MTSISETSLQEGVTLTKTSLHVATITAPHVDTAIDTIEVIKTALLNRTAKQLDPDLLEGLAALVKSENMTQGQAIELLGYSSLKEKFLDNASKLAEANTGIDLTKLPKAQILALFSHRKNIDLAIKNPTTLLRALADKKIGDLVNKGFGGIYKLMAISGEPKATEMLENIQSYMDLYVKNNKMISIENMSINELKSSFTSENFSEFGKAAMNSKIQDYVRVGKMTLSSLSKLVGVEGDNMDSVIKHTDQLLNALKSNNGIDLGKMTPVQITKFFSEENFKIWDSNKSNEDNVRAVMGNAQKVGSIAVTILNFIDKLDGKQDGTVAGQDISFLKKLFSCFG